LVATEKNDAKVVEELYFMILCRPPTPKELAHGVQAIRGAGDEHALLMAEYTKLVDAVTAYEKQLSAKQAEWEKNYRNVVGWTVLDPASAVTTGKAKLT